MKIILKIMLVALVIGFFHQAGINIIAVATPVLSAGLTFSDPIMIFASLAAIGLLIYYITTD